MTASNLRSNPYVGPRAFEIGEPIFGRDRELRQLFQLLVARRIVLLHSPSGAGKTSLVKAGLIPKLVEDGFEVLPVARLNLEPPNIKGGNVLFNRYVFSLLQSLEEDLPEELKIPIEKLVRLSLTDYLATRHEDKDKERLVVLVIDQAEDVLTIDPTDIDQKMEFFTQLGDMLRNPHLWMLFILREDYLGALESYVRALPTRLANSYRLDLLGTEPACQAIQKPAQLAGVDFTDEATKKLVDNLCEVRIQQPDGSFLNRPGPHVEPVQLQVVCHRLWKNLPSDVIQIGVEQLAKVGNVDESLAEYYSEQVQTTAGETGVSERNIRQWVESKLITPDELRGQVSMGEGTSGDLENRAIFRLVDAHLVRAEKQRGIMWFELAHDRLIKPVLKNNQEWFEQHLSLLQRQADLWAQQGKPEGLILRGQALAEAQQWADTHRDIISKNESDFLVICQTAHQLAQEKLETAQKLAEAEKVRAEDQAAAAAKLRQRAVILALLVIATLVMLVLTGFYARKANQQRVVAQIAQVQANEQRAAAETARFDAKTAEAIAEAQRAAAETAVAEAQVQYFTAEAAEATAVADKEILAAAQNLVEVLKATAQAAGTKVVVNQSLIATAQALAELEKQRATAQAEEALIQYQRECSGSQILPPCIYKIKPGDSFMSITQRAYDNEALVPGLLNFNRDERGCRKRLIAGDAIRIPSLENVARDDILTLLYPECWKNEFPCWYKAQDSEAYETIALRWLGNTSYGDIIKTCNWAWDPLKDRLITGPEIDDGLFLLLPDNYLPTLTPTSHPRHPSSEPPKPSTPYP